jgi:hypothetical protein
MCSSDLWREGEITRQRRVISVLTWPLGQIWTNGAQNNPARSPAADPSPRATMRLALLIAAAALLAAAPPPAAAAAAADGPSLTAAECERLGFTPLLLCSACDSLAESVRDAELLSECRRCCAPDVAADEVVYKSAVLEYCPHSLRSERDLEGFLRARAGGVAGLTVRAAPGAPPRLVLRGDGAARREVDLAGWKEDALVEFLATRLRAPAVAERDGDEL